MIQLIENSKNIKNSSRLMYEFINERHADLVFDKISDLRIYKYIPPNKYCTHELLRNRYNSLSKGGPDDKSCIWLNWILKEVERKVYIGWIQVTVFDTNEASIAYVIFPEYWNLGFAKEGCKTIIGHVFEEYKVNRIFAEIDTRNVPSISLVKSLGFSLFETKENADFFNGSNSDEYRYELMK
jgi:[ribosomal protein S5]-alanine N-acetyltransferase